MFTVAMRTITSSIIQRWVRMANPGNDFDYTGALIQFVLSNRLVVVAPVGRRTDGDGVANLAEWRAIERRSDVDALWERYVTPG